MGAWGVGSWDNDDACDWVYELVESKDLSPVIEALRAVTDPDDAYLESPVCRLALAAAEIVAAAAGGPGTGLPEEIEEWLDELSPNIDPKTRKWALSAVETVGREGELFELWRESDSFQEWREAVAALQSRLKALRN
jgi:hypothetical protein